MSLYTRKEFTALCRTTIGIINTNINRGKIVLFDKKIDSENPINVAFFSKYSKKAEKEQLERNKKKDAEDNIEAIYDKVVKKATKTVFKKKTTKTEEAKRKKANKEAEAFMDWEMRKKKADAVLQERKAEKEQLQLEKMAGKLIPTELAFNIIRVHNQSIFSIFQNDIENQASIFCDVLAGGDRKLLAEVNEKLSKALMDVIQRAEDVALSGIENAIEEYSETRNRGERT